MESLRFGMRGLMENACERGFPLESPGEHLRIGRWDAVWKSTATMEEHRSILRRRVR